MPELPEVETIVKDLRKKVLNKKIVQVKVVHAKAVNGLTTKFVQTLTNNKITAIDRRGKLIIFWLAHSAVILSGVKNPFYSRDPSPRLRRAQDDTKSPVAILCHLKMTGQLIYEKKVGKQIEVVAGLPATLRVAMQAGGHKLVENDFDLPNKHTQVVITFADRGVLFFNDLRRFGYMKLASQKEVEIALSRFGIEPLTKDFTLVKFLSALGKRGVSIKVALMDQSKIAGIGNIYADEICWCGGIRPTRAVSSLTASEKKKIYQCTSTVIRKAVKYRGTTFRDYLDSEGKKGNFTNFLNVYGRNGEKCARCGAIIQKIKSGGRGTHFCARCQI